MDFPEALPYIGGMFASLQHNDYRGAPVAVCMWRRLLPLLFFVSAVAPGGELAVRVTGSDEAPVPFAVLQVVGAPERMRANAGEETLVDQRDKRFVPHVTVAPPGGDVRFPNSDDTRHSVYSFSEGNEFELQLYRANDAPPVTMRQPGVVKLGCNIHDSMKAYILVTDNGSATVTDDGGRAILRSEALVPGAVVQIWHAQLAQPVEVTVSALDDELAVSLPIIWKEPQSGKSVSDLERMLRRFADDAD